MTKYFVPAASDDDVVDDVDDDVDDDDDLLAACDVVKLSCISRSGGTGAEFTSLDSDVIGNDVTGNDVDNDAADVGIAAGRAAFSR